ncbi:MAG: V-type ATP synthase subunit D [Candidatus Scalindua sp. AMX11]|nr:MAG: V-type ATP synthase subunit D [Candidatus Scalindua sp.]NOG84287.1 V-type ATP synthase subunit D [Planctomycetota bacterium]RZV67156.1 MAG: V-type ATP synthase subunit D [Candidatus Scalindua sp. SCAELEC01]TDE63657.1 MAG: V-type ATP synthase subunit D [Candidatus Scalindua sp. AMX11]GJQ60786.1 MAG: V-type ATP synthase subunit D [Candidatus Scalindua sp.]
MAKLALNKSQLKRENDQLKLFVKVLPSLELKMMQLTSVLRKAQTQLKKDIIEVEQLRDTIAEQLPMLAYRQIILEGLVKVRNIQVDEENVVGVRLPCLGKIDFDVLEYSMLAKPHWVDLFVDYIKEMITKRLVMKISEERVAKLSISVRRITQRVNLFEKILIPNARNNIQRIRIFLGDAERSAIVRSKLAKAMHQKQRKVMVEESESV